MLSEDKQYDQKVVQAEQKELSMIELYDVFEEVEKANHHCISSKSVVTEKFKNGKQVVNARLVAWGFWDTTNSVKYSPTSSRESL